jgi:two-component system, NtrC family, sensor histidine kinase HydH
MGAGGMGPGMGMGMGMGMGRGRMQRMAEDSDREEGPFAKGGSFVAALLLDRDRTDALCRRAAWLRFTVAAAGGLVVLCVGLVWRATVRLAEAHGRAVVLEIETRHLRDLGRAAAGLAHETRNPLGLIRGWTQRWADSPGLSADQRQQAQAVIEECDRVTVRINQFLAFARSAKPNWETVDIRDLVNELQVLLSPDLDAKKLVLQSDLPEKDAFVEADREMFRQALFNLLQNAIQFSPDGETVSISLSTDPQGSRQIEIADRGLGVSAASASSLFTPYFTTRSGGTGLGLAIVRSITLVHDWITGYSPRPGGGSVFWISGLKLKGQ